MDRPINRVPSASPRAWSLRSARRYLQRLQQAALGVTRSLTFKALRGRFVTVTDYMSQHGAPADWQAKWSSAFGGRVHRKYQARHGHKAPQCLNMVRGVARDVYYYGDADLDLLDEAMEHYTAKTGLTRPAQPQTPADRLGSITALLTGFNEAVQDYPGRFEGLTGEHLRDLERVGDCDAASDRIEQLLPVLDDWKQRLDVLEEALTPADLNAIIAAGPESPVATAYRVAARSFDTYQQCRDTAHSAWVNWSFTGLEPEEGADARMGDAAESPEVDERVTVPCVLDGCDGYSHPDDCTRRIDRIIINGDLEVTTELVAPNEGPLYVSVFGVYDDRDEAINVHAHTQADLDRLAEEFERLAAMIRKAGASLHRTSAVQPTTGVCARCERTWPEADLSDDANGDPVCCDCHASDPGDDRAEYRAYAHAGR
ncbi:hypothetical protein GXW83_27345 [Streptacidiphilus sp. PB12-B1b]|uniref:hypothetical protein n=1 Tax=Streptacidiphilus sp. PB12-B1b TaxID=2705012 RepID=UPI0015F84FE1|nr:hypothetical protein [Streptacidiphilus sp. PB12-B1b]QMU78862.1 hypothetical protein GXW83_27345 [Streptacidiphilus sp. PB12-B1b]